MNSKLIKLISLFVAVLMTVGVMAACSSDDKSADSAAEVKTSETAQDPSAEAKEPEKAEEAPEKAEETPKKTEEAPAKTEEASEKAEEAPKKTEDAPEKAEEAPQKEAEASSEEVKGKYADMETYEKDGVEYGKTEDGKEVAISGENMQKLIEQYQKVQGSGSESEQELLDQLQVILDNAEVMQEN